MERAPFEWSRPVRRERDVPPRPEQRMPFGRPGVGQPYLWAAPIKRPRFRYVDDTPRMGRVGGAAFLAFLMLLAFGAVWVIEQDFKGPSTAAEPTPQSAAAEPQDESPAALDEEPLAVRAGGPEGPPLRQSEGSRLRELAEPNVPAARTRVEPPPVIGTREPPLTRPARSTPPPPARSIPFPTSPPLSQQVMQPPAVEPTPPPRVAAANAVPSPTSLPRVPVDEPTLTPPPIPPPEPPPVAAAPAPAAPPPTAARTPAADVDNSAIRDVLGRYRSAFNTLDARAAQQVWPSVDARTLDRAFGQLQQQNVSFDRCTIAVKGSSAEANCNGTTRFVPRVGSRSEQTESRQWNFSLRKANSGWQIQDVDAH